jgi:DNA-binding transcriptional LysR family regulator
MPFGTAGERQSATLTRDDWQGPHGALSPPPELGESAMQMNQVRYFLAVCEALNFTRAAEKCHVSQPALTRGIQALEAELGGFLFRRKRAATQLTDLGELMRPYLESIFRQAEVARTTARSFLKLEDAPLKLGVMCTIGPLRFMKFLNHFHAEHPGIELTIVEATHTRLSELLLNGTLDVAVMAQPKPFDECFNARKLYDERFVVAFPRGHKFEDAPLVRIKDIDGETYLSRINCEYQDYFDYLCRNYEVDVVEAHRSEREDWIQALVIAGMGISFMPEYSVSLPGIVVRELTEPTVMRAVTLITVGNRSLNRPVSALVASVESFAWP